MILEFSEIGFEYFPATYGETKDCLLSGTKHVTSDGLHFGEIVIK